MTRFDQSRTARAIALLTVTGGLVLAGCGTDDDSASKTTTTTASTTKSGGTTDSTKIVTAGDGSEAACTAYSDLTMAVNGEPEGDPATYVKDTILPLADDLEASKPAELAAEVDTMIAAVKEFAAKEGDFAAFEAPEFVAARATIDSHVFANCEFDNKIEVSGKEFVFEGLPKTVDAGRTAILFTNAGAEAHEIGLVRKKDGVLETFEELLALPEEEAGKKIEFKGNAFASKEGDQALVIADLDAGSYLAICFVPTGTTVDDSGQHEGSGPPHFMEGMQQEFSVS